MSARRGCGHAGLEAEMLSRPVNWTEGFGTWEGKASVFGRWMP